MKLIIPETWQVHEKIIIFNFLVLGQAEEVAWLQASPDQPLPQEGLPQSRRQRGHRRHGR
jgi:hypothetical protein